MLFAQYRNAQRNHFDAYFLLAALTNNVDFERDRFSK